MNNLIPIIIIVGLLVLITILLIQRYSITDETIYFFENSNKTTKMKPAEIKPTVNKENNYFGAEIISQKNLLLPFIKDRNKINGIYLYSGYISSMDLLTENDELIYCFTYGNAIDKQDFIDYQNNFLTQTINQSQSDKPLPETFSFFNWRTIGADPTISITKDSTSENLLSCCSLFDSQNLMYQNLVKSGVTTIISSTEDQLIELNNNEVLEKINYNKEIFIKNIPFEIAFPRISDNNFFKNRL